MDSVRQVPKCFGSAQTLARFGDNEDDVTNVVVDSVLVEVTAKMGKKIVKIQCGNSRIFSVTQILREINF